MRPIPGAGLHSHTQRVYNCRLSRARRTIENSFGIMVSRWRSLKRNLHITVDHANAVILTCCVLHNIMRVIAPATYTPPGYADAVYLNGQIVEELGGMTITRLTILGQSQEDLQERL